MQNSKSDAILSRLSVSIDLARICTMFLIATGHFMQMKGFYAHFTQGSGYPFQPDDFQHFQNSLSAQTWAVDKYFLMFNFSYWSLNFTFFALSGLSLWLSCRTKNTFTLGSYFTGRFFGVYLGYALAATAAFLMAITLLGHTPGQHDLNYLLLGVARARETYFYNDTLWFMAVLFILYMIYPAIPFLYSKIGTLGIIAVWALCFYFFNWKGALARESFLPIAFSFFMTGILAAEVVFMLRRFLDKHALGLATALAALAIGAAAGLYQTLYLEIVAKGRFEYSTHAAGMLFFVLFLSAGMLLPMLKSNILRLAGTATYTVYLFHYLLVRVFNNNQAVHDALAKAASLAPWPFQESIFAASAALFALFMAAGMLYGRYILAPLTKTLRNCLDREIILRKQ
ncbi:MAG: acyltransferase family protein [Acidobacteriota bacterium]